MNSLQQINDVEQLEGYLEHVGRKGYKVFVNVEKLWKDTADFKKFSTKVDKFVEDFISTYVHEVIHFVIRTCYKMHPKWLLGDELVVWSLTEEPMPRATKKFYCEDLKYNRGDKNLKRGGSLGRRRR